MSDNLCYAVVLVVFLVPAAIVFVGYVRIGMLEAEAQWRRKMRRCFCVRCGYSLTGNISGRCPECGKPIRK